VCSCLATKNTLAIDMVKQTSPSLFGKLTHPTDREASPAGMLNQIEKMLKVL
jgi:hypothetical protein